MEIIKVISKATGVLPIKRSASTQVCEPSIIFATLNVFKPVSNKIKRIGSNKIVITRVKLGGFCTEVSLIATAFKNAFGKST